MVLTSQSPQPSLRRQYMARRRRPMRWPWIVVGVAVVVALIVLLTSDPQETTQQADAAPAAPAAPGATAARTSPPPRPRQAAPTRAAAESAPAPRAPQPAAPPSTPTPIPVTVANGDAPGPYTEGMALIADGKLIEGRAVLSRLLFDDTVRLRPADAATVRDTLASINRDLVFGKAINEDDPLVDRHVIESGDYLVKIAPRYHVTSQFIQSLNGVDPQRLMVGQKLKVVRGPFHARISKREFRLDVYLKDDMGDPIYVASMPVGLGEGGSTPVGNWVIKPGSKIENPGWTNPRTGQTFDRNDPRNPIGEYWLALQGADPTTESLAGYGIHGTIDPDSVGTQQSMGCVRLRDADIELLFNLMVPGESTVQITP